MLSNIKKLLFLNVLLIFSCLIALLFGSLNIPLEKFLTIAHYHFANIALDSHLNMLSTIIFDIRLPRIIFTIFTGIGLSLVGLLLQTITQNELSDPYILGVSSGASTGAVGAIVFSWLSVLSPYNITICAFLGAILSTIIVLCLVGNNSNPSRLVLMGVGISALFSALTMVIIYSAKYEGQVRSAMFWLLGNLSGIQWPDIYITAICIFIFWLLTYFFRYELDLLSLGQQNAQHLGMNVQTLHYFTIIICSGIIALLVSQVGVIGFIGLIIPHIARLFFGANHQKLIIFTPILGAIIMVWADLISRIAVAPEELPIGVLTSIIGAPLFLWIIHTKYDKLS